MANEKFRDSTLSPAERAADLLSRLTLREKVGQVNQRLYGFNSYARTGDRVELSEDFQKEVERWGGLGVLYGLYRADPWADKDYATGLTGDTAVRAYNLAQRYVIEHSRFGIPMLLSTECPHGHQALDGYLLPVNLAMGAAWNPALVEEAFGVVGSQIREMGVDFALVSMLDVLRDPRWGRSEECYSEDPYLCAKNAEAAVRGCLSGGVDAVAKHFCAQGETTGGVNASAARIGERELREIHMPPMAAAAKAGAKGRAKVWGRGGASGLPRGLLPGHGGQLFEKKSVQQLLREHRLPIAEGLPQEVQRHHRLPPRVQPQGEQGVHRLAGGLVQREVQKKAAVRLAGAVVFELVLVGVVGQRVQALVEGEGGAVFQAPLVPGGLFAALCLQLLCHPPAQNGCGGDQQDGKNGGHGVFLLSLRGGSACACRTKGKWSGWWRWR